MDGYTPSENCNKLKMLIGKLRVEHKDALDGVAVTFGAESEGLELSCNVAEEVKARGFVQSKTLSSLATLRADGKIPVSVVDVPRTMKEGKIAICTIPEASVDSVKDMFTLNRISGMKATLVVDDADNGMKTISVAMERMGVAIIIK